MDFLNLELAAGVRAAVHWVQSRRVGTRTNSCSGPKRQSLLMCKPEDKRKHVKDVEAAPQIQLPRIQR